jgi:hypothetical protein
MRLPVCQDQTETRVARSIKVTRMHILIVALMVLPGLHAGCAGVVYRHPAYTPQLWARDSYECERDARQSGSFGTGILGGMAIRDSYDRRLAARGWTKTQELNSN